MQNSTARRLLALLVIVTLILQITLTTAPTSAQTNPKTTPLPTRATQLPSPTPGSGLPTPTPSPLPSPTAGPKLVTRTPNLQAPAAIAVEADTGRILYAKNIHMQKAMASTTKTTTALTFLSMFPSYDQLKQLETTVVQEDLVGEANMGLRRGERITLYTLLLGLMTNSANEAGMVLARYAGNKIAGPADPVDRFVAAMNAYALSVGMYDSHYMNPHGLDQAGHYSSAHDLALTGWYYLRNPLLMQLAQYKSGMVEGHTIYNVNSFLGRYPGANGVKPGWTDAAGRCLVASAQNNGKTVIVVVLDSPDISGEADRLMDYSFSLLEGKTEVPLEKIDLGYLNLPRPGNPNPNRAITTRGLESALKLQLEHTLRLTVALVPLNNKMP